MEKQPLIVEFGLCKDCRIEMVITDTYDTNDPMTGDRFDVITFDCPACHNNKNKIAFKQNRYSVSPQHDIIAHNGQNGLMIR